MKYPVGTKYTRRVARNVTRDYTVVDYHITRNMSGEVVKERYVTSHEFMGQALIDYDVTQTEIDRALWMPDATRRY